MYIHVIQKIIALCCPAAVSVKVYGDLHMKGHINGAQGDAGQDQLNSVIDDSE